MMTDSDQVKRQKAVNTVLNIRAAKSSNCSVIREFKVPNIDFNASEWHEMIDWDNTTVTESPLTAHLTTEQIKAIEITPLSVPNYPNNTQGVERCIKVVTESSKAVYGEDARDGFIRARISSRTCLPKFDTKKHFSSASKYWRYIVS